MLGDSNQGSTYHFAHIHHKPIHIMNTMIIRFYHVPHTLGCNMGN